MPETCVTTKKVKLKNTVVIYQSLFKNTHFIGYSLLSALIYTFTIGFYNFTPFVLYYLKMSPLWSGILNGLYACSLALGAFSLGKWLYKIDSKKLFLFVLVSYLIVFIIFYGIFSIKNIFLFICVFAVLLAYLCGIVAPLTLSLCMEEFVKNKGIASAAQSFIKMLFTGITLLSFNFITLSSIKNIIIFNFLVGLLMIAIFLYLEKDNLDSPR